MSALCYARIRRAERKWRPPPRCLLLTPGLHVTGAQLTRVCMSGLPSAQSANLPSELLICLSVTWCPVLRRVAAVRKY